MELKYKLFFGIEWLVDFVNKNQIKKENIQNILKTDDAFYLVYVIIIH